MPRGISIKWGFLTLKSCLFAFEPKNGLEKLTMGAQKCLLSEGVTKLGDQRRKSFAVSGMIWGAA